MSRARHTMQKKAMGGKMKANIYNAAGSPEMKEAHDTTDGFKKGGTKKKAGGSVPKGKSHMRLDKKPRKHAAGGAVLSTASKKSAAEKSSAGQGHEGDGPKGEDPDRGCYADGGRTKKWISGAIKNPGGLHRALKVPEGEKIPASKMSKAAHSDNPRVRRMAALAKTLKKMH